jgi:prepilin-type N-terminal cleavage/methylation domain-containing protein
MCQVRVELSTETMAISNQISAATPSREVPWQERFRAPAASSLSLPSSKTRLSGIPPQEAPKGRSMPKTPRQSGFTFLELIIVVAMGLVVAGFAIPNYQRAMRNYRLMGDSRAIRGEIQLAKMRAASNFTRARVRFGAGGTYVTELWCVSATTPRVCAAANVWKSVNTGTATNQLSSGIGFGVASQTLPPPSTQVALSQPMTCRDGLTMASATSVPASRCIIFNSRGYPVDEVGSAYGDYGIYVTDNGAVEGTTVSRAGVVMSWRHDAQDTAAASWFRR